MGLWCFLLLYMTCQCTFGEFLIQESLSRPSSTPGENEGEDLSLPNEPFETESPKKRSVEPLQWQNIKKIPKFSSWGGKRSLLEPKEDCPDPEICDDLYPPLAPDGLLPYLWDKRASRFNSWGGKRAPSRFNSWGGKRDWMPVRDERGKFASWGGKRDEEALFRDERGKFASWGGKRAEDDDPILVESRGRFNSWGGKRGLEDDEDDLEEEKRGKFASWGGKRSNEDENCTTNCDNELSPDLDKRSANFFLLKGGHSSFPKGWKRRPLFSSWGGKRTESPPLNIYDYIKLMEFLHQHDHNEETIEKKKDDQDSEETTQQKRGGGESGKRRPGFSSWGGKRTKFASWGGKRSVFSSWGKRRNINFQQLIDSLQSAIGKRYPLYKVRDGKRIIPFSSWGGKRSYPDFEAHIRKRSLNADEFNNAFPLAFKRSPLNKYLINRYYLINSVLKDGQWTSVLRPIRRGSDFYPWGGKRST